MAHLSLVEKEGGHGAGAPLFLTGPRDRRDSRYRHLEGTEERGKEGGQRERKRSRDLYRAV